MYLPAAIEAFRCILVQESLAKYHQTKVGRNMDLLASSQSRSAF
nr:MAG TPA: hypothetical protein [Caudoviricetes sp.]